ncbi:host specificity protein J [Xenorhabdus griffiniae]|uniref:host specificity protein J n=1 Tax=Xenorhabdus griffiniae TaxID=351672 RepID=UPI0023585D92|nr:host specificity protein J [Xenorhabdus griffiniae]MDC9605609.1 host specificity protein J [Xenorhabdus griffiniae]
MIEHNHNIEGAKGGGGGGHTPYEMPDNIQSNAKARILLALGEGEFVSDLTAKDIYLDGTPLQSDNGMNFEGVKWEFRPGTQHQSYIKGMPAAENEIRINTEIKDITPWTKYISNTKLSAVRVRLGWPALRMQKDNGDTVGYRIDYAIELSTDGGSYQTIFDTHIDAKTTTLYERSYRINLPDAKTGWTVRVVRKTASSTSERTIDKMNLMAFTEIIDAKLRYPNTALLYVEFDARLFNGNVPLISCKPKGRIIRVPSNYDPVNRTYSGIWNGTFKWAHSNNPAWVLYDLLLNDLCGLGDKIDKTQIDETELYRVAQYCDQPVPDGKGGHEPRFTCDVYIQSREEAHKVLTDIGAIFRGSVYWGANQFVAMADMPDDIKYIFTQASVINGDFVYSSGGERNRSTVAMVSWSNPDNHYNDEVEVVSDDNLIRRYGINQIDIAAIGCTRQSEAQRRGKWAILTNSRDTMISFRVGLDGQIPMPGQIIGVAHKNRAGRVIGGRIRSAAGRNIILDRKPDAHPGDRLLVNLLTGKTEGRTVQEVNGNIVTVTTTYSEIPQAEAGWAVDANDLFIQQYRVVGIKDNNDGTFEINGLYHDPDKYARIDTGARIDERPISIIPASVQQPSKSVNIESFSFVQQGISTTTVRISWEPAEGAVAYIGEWRRDSGNWISIPRSASLGFEIPNAYSGRYQARIKAINSFDIPSLFTSSEEVNITGKQGNPPTPLAFKTTPIIFGIQLDWGFAAQTDDTLKTEIQYSRTNDGEGLMLLADIPYPQRTHTMQGLAAGVAFWFRARLVDKSGNQSPWTEFVRGESSDDASWIIDAAGEQFMTAEAGKRLQSQLDYQAEAALINGAANQENAYQIMVKDGENKAEIRRLDRVFADSQTAWAQQITEVKAEIQNDIKASVLENEKAITKLDLAQAESERRTQAQFKEQSAVISSKMQAEFSQNAGYAIHSINITINRNGTKYNAGGMVISGEFKNGSLESYIGFSANNFAFYNPLNGRMEPFMVVKNGQLFVRDAFIDMANIRQLLVGLDIKSTNYIPNQRGFRFDASTGAFDFNDMRFRAGLRWANGAIACYDQNGRVRAAMGYIGQFR